MITGAATTASAGPRLGLMADVGVPDGAAASIAIHPLRPIRIHLGMTHNMVSTGLRAGLSFVAFPSAGASPTLSVAYGRYPEGDANPIVAYALGDPAYMSPLLERVGYDFADAHVGLEFGPRRGRFFLDAGVSRITTTIHGIAEAAAGDQPMSSITLSSEPELTVWTVSARLGLVVYL